MRGWKGGLSMLRMLAIVGVGVRGMRARAED